MDPGEQITGTRDEHYNLVSVLYHALEGAETCDTYAIDAEAAGDERLAVFFREAQEVQVGLAERAKMLLGIIEVPPEPAVAPDVPPEGAVTPGTVSGGMPPGLEVPPGEAPLAEPTAQLVAEVMTSEVVTVEPQTSIADTARRMIEEEKGPLPVVEGERLVGMITDRDIIARVVAEGLDADSTTVGDVATAELVTITSDRDVAEAVQLMADHELDRILVVEGERLVGIISEADVRLDEGSL
jgi:CBS domain-containing protein